MRVIPEHVLLVSYLLLAAACLLSRSIWGISVLIVVLLGLTIAKRFWSFVSARSLRSLAILVVIVFVPFLGAYREGLVAVGKVIGLFLISLLAFRGLGAPGLSRAANAVCRSGVGQLMLLPFLFGKLNYEWQRAEIALLFRCGRVPRVWRWLNRLRIVCWQSHFLPVTVNVSYRVRVGSTEAVLNREEAGSVGLGEAGLFFIALASMIWAIVGRSF